MSDGTVPKDARAVAFAYNTPPYGKVLVVERLPDVPPEDYDAASHQLVQSNTGSSILAIDPIAVVRKHSS